MAKIKTKKCVSKRFKIKKSKKGIKIMKCTDGRGHFNGKEPGKVTRQKRTDNVMSDASKKTILRAMPHA